LKTYIFGLVFVTLLGATVVLLNFENVVYNTRTSSVPWRRIPATVLNDTEGTALRAENSLTKKTSKTQVLSKPVKNHTIACMFFAPNDSYPKIKPVLESWAPRVCDYIEILHNETKGLNWSFPESSNALSHKSHFAWRYMYKKYFSENATGPKPDWLMKLDFDTYIVTENLQKYITRFNPADRFYIGKSMKQYFKAGWGAKEETFSTFVAGAAVLMSRGAMKVVNQALTSGHPFCTVARFKGSGHADDARLARCLRAFGIFPHDTRDENGLERFTVFAPKFFHRNGRFSPPKTGKGSWWYPRQSFTSCLGSECNSPEAISFHYVRPEDMKKKLVYDAEKKVWVWEK